jgi:hypothetical protein
MEVVALTDPVHKHVSQRHVAVPEDFDRVRAELLESVAVVGVGGAQS